MGSLHESFASECYARLRQSASEFRIEPLAAKEDLTGQAFVDAMQQARKLGLKLKPLRYYPAYRPPVRFEDEGK